MPLSLSACTEVIMSTQSSIEDIRDQEEDIFEDLSKYDFPSAEAKTNYSFIKEKAKQQLTVSSDSPFNYNDQELYEAELRRLKNERVAALKEETDEIRRQLDFVKNRLGELKKSSGGNNKSANNDCAQNSPRLAPTMHNIGERLESDGETTDSNQKFTTSKQIKGNRSTVQSEPEPRLRPLTGKADCPNCICDRRKSVCNKCIALASASSGSYGPNSFGSNRIRKCRSFDRESSNSLAQNEAAIRRNINCSSFDDDERPIKPARGRPIAKVEAVNDVVVPSKVYTISKSLNEKRTKLAEAINDLQLIIDQVKEKGNKLNNERKVVQLYKDQWKFGPSIGGPSASSRERIGLMNQKRNYQSRLDPNLNRDYKSVTGFQHIEPVIKLRQYNPKPRPAPRTKIQQGKKQTPQQPRSRSLESLNSRVSFNSKISTPNAQKAIANFQNGKASSELNLSLDSTASVEPSTITIEEKFEEVEEDIEEVEDNIEGSNSLTYSDKETLQRLDSEIGSTGALQPKSENRGEQEERNDSVSNSSESAQKVKRMTWIPVFGETEIKTVKRPSTNRKVQIITPEKEQSSKVHSCNKRNEINNLKLKPKRPTINYKSLERHQKISKNTLIDQNNINDRVMSEAKKKLKFASDLMEKEQSDSGTKNQLIINKSSPVPRPRSSAPSYGENSSANQPKQAEALSRISDTNKEIERLEEMVNEQQKLLNKLAQSQDRQLKVSPITVRCSSPICCQHATAAKGLNISNSHSNRSLFHGLRDRLNKSKARLARTLEAEREKHQQLKQKVDSSLRKQTDLESENKILKQSLNKCIDTCLKDISNTFESLSATLNDSIENSALSDKHAIGDEESDIGSLDNSSSSLLTNAAQLISDNKYLKQMKSHVEKIEQQRKSIFEELSKEKQKSNHLESQLRENQTELIQLIDIKKKLEAKVALATNINQDQQSAGDNQLEQTCSNKTQSTLLESQPTTSKYSEPNLSSNQATDADKSELDTESYNSVEVYRRYIQSMSPDMESLRQERKLIMSELVNMKKMLSDMDR